MNADRYRTCLFTKAIAAAMAVAALLCPTPVHGAPQYSILHTFNGGTGGIDPSYGQLLLASDGNLYGVTLFGGAAGEGSIYRYSKTGEYQTIYSFTGTTHLQDPNGSLVEGSDGDLYGTTMIGGVSGNGTVYKIGRDGKRFVQMYQFTGGAADGGNPTDGLVIDSNGNLYGATESYGANGVGTIYTIKTTGTSVTLLGSLSRSIGAIILSPLALTGATIYGAATAGGANNLGALISVPEVGGAVTAAYSFGASAATGYVPQSVLAASDGNLYGVTQYGGIGCGVIFAYYPSTSTTSALYTFQGLSDGEYPACMLYQSPSGLLYGTTTYFSNRSGDGAVFSIPLTGGTPTIIHSFLATDPDFFGDESGVVIGSDGALYGTAASGGLSNDGALFRLALDGSSFSVLYGFADEVDGLNPLYGPLLSGADGRFHGTTAGSTQEGVNNGTVYSVDPKGDYRIDSYVSGSPYGGLAPGTGGSYYGTTWQGGTYGAGSVFQILPSDSSFDQIYSFGEAVGAFIPSGLLLASDGNYYGESVYGGQYNSGTIFCLSPLGYEEVLYSFTGGADGYEPNGGLIQASDGDFYGTTNEGGASGYGSVFRFSLTKGLTTLASFDGDVINGAYPYAGVTEADDGELYGTVSAGPGHVGSYGAIYSLSKNGAGFSSKYFFVVVNGAVPMGTITQGSDGRLYGTTQYGGPASQGLAGIVYSIATSLDYKSFKIIHSFTYRSSGANIDGYEPLSGVTEGPDGNFYGTCSLGGISPYTGATVAGTVYKIKTMLPIINSFSPSSGLGGQQVTIYGANFGASPAVDFSRIAASVISSTSSQIVVTVPTKATTGIITVKSRGVTIHSPSSFLIDPPSITSLSESSGHAGDTLTITGANFVGVTGVDFAGPASASFTVINPETISVVVPSNGKTGLVKVTTYGGIAKSEKSFTYK